MQSLIRLKQKCSAKETKDLHYRYLNDHKKFQTQTHFRRHLKCQKSRIKNFQKYHQSYIILKICPSNIILRTQRLERKQPNSEGAAHDKLFPNSTTLKCVSIGTPKTINFPFVPNGKFMGFKCPNIQAHHNCAVIFLKFGTPKTN